MVSLGAVIGGAGWGQGPSASRSASSSACLVAPVGTSGPGGGGGEEPPPHSRPVCALQLQACLVCWVILGLIIGSWAPSGLGPLLGEGVGQAGAHFKLGQSPEIFAVW